MTDKALQVVDPKTGEMLEVERVSGDILVVGTDAVIEAMENGQLPLYIRKLQELGVPEEEKEPILSLYIGGAFRSFDYYVNNVVEIQGAAILYHGPYMSRPVKDSTGKVIAESQPQPGYYFTAFLTTQEDEKGNLIVLRSSGAFLMLHAAYMVNQRGWFLWEKPIKYRVTRGENGDHRLQNTEKPKGLKVAKRQGV